MSKFFMIMCNLALAFTLVGADTVETKGLSAVSKVDRSGEIIAVIGMVASFILVIVLLLMLNKDDKKYQ